MVAGGYAEAVPSRPRVVAAQISHETNAFSAVRTDFAAFERAGLDLGEAILPKARDTNSIFGGFASGAEEVGLDLVPLVSVWATPSGIVTRDAIARLEGLLTDGLARSLSSGPVAGVLLALHGAMVTEESDDGDGHILGLVRRIVGPRVPIVATLDLHANISPSMVELADVLIGYDTYPHVDMAARAHEACGLLARLIDHDIQPVTALRKPPMLPTSQKMTTDRDPMRALMARAHAMERSPSVINVTVAGGFPSADVVDAGFGVLVTTDGDQELADCLADELAAEAWARRDQFLGGVASFAEAAAIIRAPAADERPIVLVDIGDNPWTGGPGDSAELVRFLFREGIGGGAVALIADPDAVRMSVAAGVGATVELTLGGKTDRRHGDPLSVRAVVQSIADGRYVNEGPMMTGLTVNLGPSVVLVCASPGTDELDGGVTVEVLVTSRAETPIDVNVFRAHGIEPTHRRVLGLKGKGHFRAAFEPIAREIILVEGPGITGADLSRLDFRKVRRPIWPLDPL